MSWQNTLLFICVLSGLFQLIGSWCKPYSIVWEDWTPCTHSCGGGTQSRHGRSCVRHLPHDERKSCNEFCYFNHAYNGGMCRCPSWRTGHCCETCRHIYIDHCHGDNKVCGGNPDRIKCTKCLDPYYSGGYGGGCRLCPQISNCFDRYCSNRLDTKCSKCEDDNVFYKRTHSNTKCERMCSFDTYSCWPGSCSDELTSSCMCADGFRRVTAGHQTTCQLNHANAPSINKCQTKIIGPNGEAVQTKPRACNELNDVYGNFQPTSFTFEMQSDFEVNISTWTRPKYIAEEMFGITDAFVHTKRTVILGKEVNLDTFNQKIDRENSTNATSTVDSEGNYTLFHPKYNLTNGEWLCIQYEVFGGGYVKTHDFRNNTNRPAVPYQKTRTLKTICYRYDDSEPQHCLNSNSCSSSIEEPLQIQKRVTRTSIIPVSFAGWIDPIPANGNSSHASGIDSYEITVNEVSSGKVHTNKVFSKIIEYPKTQITLNLTSDGPRLYSITLGVKDIANNIQQARRFVLYDNTTFITPNKDKPFIVMSASKITNYKWQTNHNNICLNWKDHFYNKFYMDNSLLGKINDDPNGFIRGIYEQQSGLLPVSGTKNIFGITHFHFASSLNGGPVTTETLVPDFMKQTFCKTFPLKDGQTYSLYIKATDIANNSYSENRTVHIDRTVPHINNLGLIKHGIKRLFVHDDTDLSKMTLYVDVLDPHSGILNIEWSFGTLDPVRILESRHIGTVYIDQEICAENVTSCYCPDIGKCEKFTHNVPLNMLVRNNTHKGNHNRNYFFTVKATNNARLSNIEHIDILVDDSPPEMGVINEGAVGTPDIDFTSDTTFQVHWQGFIDHESGIKEYVLGLADACLRKEQLLMHDDNSNITGYTKLRFTESTVRMHANFTGKKYVSIIAINNALEPSESACSDGITRDDTSPELKNLILKNGRWSESLYCHNGKAWLFRSDLKRLKLPDIAECYERCVSDSLSRNIFDLLPIEENINNDTSVGEFICKTLPAFDLAQTIYLPNDDFYISWDVSETGSQIEDISVGFGRTSDNISALSVMDYTVTNGKHHFQIRHLGAGAEDLFYVYIKTVNKANLEKIIVFGPILIDETPPYFDRKPTVMIENGMVTVGWNNDTVYDPEQAAQINQMLFEIVHDQQVVSPSLEWRLGDSQPCAGFNGGCLKYPLKKLQKADTDIGLYFTFRVYAFNNAGHFTRVETEQFKVPSRYPPGHAVVRDVDPEIYPTLLKDVNVHFTPNKLCAHWQGFKHHENVTLEIGVGTKKVSADLLPFKHTNASNTTCIQSYLIQFNTEYFFHLRASCSGGKTFSVSNGVTIVNETDFVKMVETRVGEKNDLVQITWSSRMASDKDRTIFCPTKRLQIGQIYKLVLKNLTRNVTVFSNDSILLNKSTYDSKDMTMEIIAVAINEHPCIVINLQLTSNITPIVYTTTDSNNTVVSKSIDTISVRWTYAGLEKIIYNLTFDISLGEIDEQSNSSHYSLVTGLSKSHGHIEHLIPLSILNPERKYIVLIKPCTSVRCIGPLFSREFEIESSITSGHLLSCQIQLDYTKSCIDIVLQWTMFEAKSNVTLYQWSISKHKDAATTLTKWKTLLNDMRKFYNVTECISLPVFGHSTLYICVRAYSSAGNIVTTCKRASVVEKTELNKNIIYDIDASIDSWNYIKKMIHSSNIGSKYTLLHDAEMDFGTTNTSVIGTLMYATERNVTWYLMKKKQLPFSNDCNKDSDCIYSTTTDNGYVLFDKQIVNKNMFYYTCAYSDATSVTRELFTEVLKGVGSCSNGFIIDDSPPTGGHVHVENTGGFITTPTEIELSWNGFDDNVDADELGYIDRIKQYSYAIGTRPGVDDIKTYAVVGNVKRVVARLHDIADGTVVFVSVKATDHAGLSREVYSDELKVDETAPASGTIIISGNSTYISASSCELLLFGFKDDQSGIDHFEVGIGSDVALVDIKPMMRFSSDHTFVELSKDMHDGYRYFFSVKAINRAGLSSTLVKTSFILDRSSPTGGHVLDGNWQTEKDIDYQRELGYIQGHWKGFTDPHSGIKSYKAGLGTKPNKNDIEEMVDVGLRTDITWNGTYEIGKRYYITVEACNVAGLCRSVSSDGIVLDNSPPIHGIVKVGSRQQHQPYLPNGASVHISWVGFEDPQSGIDHYEYCIGTKALLCDITDYTTCLLESSIIKTGLRLTHSKNYYVSVKAFNKAGVSVEATSDTFTIDDTPPVLVQKPGFLLDYNAITGEKAQWDKSVLRIFWKFEDAESKIASHTITLKTHHEGHTPVENIHLGNVDELTLGLDDKNWLNNGDSYFVVVTSCNTAGLCSTSKSDKLLIDSSPPHQGGFKPPLFWHNFIDTLNSTKSRLSLSWYGFVDPESEIDSFYITVSRSYTGQELSGCIAIRLVDNNQVSQNKSINLNKALQPDENLILTIWAKNVAGLNSSVSKITVNVISSQKSNLQNASGILEIQKHSCDVHFCNKDCTCAVVGLPCVDVSTNDNCTTLNVTEVQQKNMTTIVVFGGLLSNPQNITLSSACLSAHWLPQGDEKIIQRYEWSMGIKDQPVGEGIFNLKSERPWNDVGKRKETVYCLSLQPGLEHNKDYIIYVRAWYSKNVFAEFVSAPIHVDQTPPHHATGKHITDSDSTCSKDYDVIDWMDTISACWDQVFTERQGKILNYYISLGTTINGSDIYKRTNVGLQTNSTLYNISLSHGTKYYITVTAFNNVGLHTTLSSDGFVVDMDKPIAGVVFNTEKHTDITYQSSSSTFSISWHGFIDHFSGIKSYYVALVESSLSNYENVSFKNVGLQTKHRFSHLSLTHTKSYKGLVKAVDNAGHVSEIAISGGKIIDTTAPEPFHCQEFQTVNISLSVSSALGTASFQQNVTQHNRYVIKGVLEGVSIDVTPLLSVGRYQFPLPVAINYNGSAEFEYSFLSPISGETMFSVSTSEPSASKMNFSIHIEMLVCSSEIVTTHSRKAVQLRQIGPLRLAVDIKILDRESSLYKVQLGAGTTPGGLQLRPLRILYGGTSSVIDIDSEHASKVHVTVVAENHAGSRSIFNAIPVTIDKTPPTIVQIESKIAEYFSNSNGTTTALNIAAKWKVADQESGIKYCLCGIGKSKSTTAIEKLRLSDTTESCWFRHIQLQHGDTIFVSVRCINNVEMATEIVSDKMTVSTEAPKTANVNSRFIVAGNIEASYASPYMSGQESIGTFIQTDRSKVMLEWSGFVDLSEIDHYEYRLMCRNDTVVGWRSSGKRTMIEMKGLDLTEHFYTAEVKAVNPGQFTSSAVISEVIVHDNEPKLTGKPLLVSENGQLLRFDWSDVFRLSDGVAATYDVNIGSKHGYADIIQLLFIEAKHCDVPIPQTTILTQNVQELYITITCTYSTGLYTVYRSSYKM